MSDKEHEADGDGPEKYNRTSEENPEIVENSPQVEESTSEAISPSTREDDQEGPSPLAEEIPVCQNASLYKAATFPEESQSSESNIQSEQRDISTEQSTEGEKHQSDSPNFSLASGCNSPLEGAVGNKVLENGVSSDSLQEFNRRFPALDFRALYAGKLDVFHRYFDHNVQFYTRPERRRRHNAERHRNLSEGCFPRSDEGFSNDNPLGHLQTLEPEPEPEPLLNQAGAIVGTRSRSPAGFFDNGVEGPLAGFGYVGEEHSLGSAETVPIGEIYSGNFSPARPCSEVSSRGVSSGSFPSFSSRSPTSSDNYDTEIRPSSSSDSLNDAKPISSDSTDSDDLPAAARPVRRRRTSVRNKPYENPHRSDSELAGSEGSDSDENERQNNLQKSTRIPDAADSNGGENMPKESFDGASGSEPPSSLASEDEAELNFQSVDSDDCQPMPDLDQDLASLLQNLNSSNVSMGMPPAPPESERDQVAEQSTDSTESDSEPEPISVVSRSSKDFKNLKQNKLDEDKNKK